eukprot:6534704-Prorocentrum_lima.AAC.1
MKTTHVDRTQTNERVYGEATRRVRNITGKEHYRVRPLEEVYMQRKVAMLADILCKGTGDPRYHL